MFLLKLFLKLLLIVVITGLIMQALPGYSSPLALAMFVLVIWYAWREIQNRKP